jgi:hypothetical protein
LKDYTPEGYIRTTFYLKKELKERIQQEALLQRRTITEVFNKVIEQRFDLWDEHEPMGTIGKDNVSYSVQDIVDRIIQLERDR